MRQRFRYRDGEVSREIKEEMKEKRDGKRVKLVKSGESSLDVTHGWRWSLSHKPLSRIALS